MMDSKHPNGMLVCWVGFWTLALGGLLWRVDSPAKAAIPRPEVPTHIWGERCMGDGGYMSRCPVQGGWVVYASKGDINRASVAVDLLFVPDVEHTWVWK